MEAGTGAGFTKGFQTRQTGKTDLAVNLETVLMLMSICDRCRSRCRIHRGFQTRQTGKTDLVTCLEVVLMLMSISQVQEQVQDSQRDSKQGRQVKLTLLLTWRLC